MDDGGHRPLLCLLFAFLHDHIDDILSYCITLTTINRNDMLQHREESEEMVCEAFPPLPCCRAARYFFADVSVYLFDSPFSDSYYPSAKHERQTCRAVSWHLCRLLIDLSRGPIRRLFSTRLSFFAQERILEMMIGALHYLILKNERSTDVII
jgi:hypothetical protein